MGKDSRELRVFATVSNHNSDQDLVDNALWEELEARIYMICQEHRYESINPVL